MLLTLSFFSGLAPSQDDLRLPESPVSRRITVRRRIPPGERFTYARMTGPGCIRRLQVSLDYRQEVNRSVVLRIYFDDQPVPYVEAPLGDFFGAMNNVLHYPLNTPFLSIQPKNTYTCFFPMPFAKSARVELEAAVETPVYLHLDWHSYPGQEMKESRRFCARWRREMPAQAHGEDFLMLDADGPGQLLGFVYAVNMLRSKEVARWSHGGADNIYIDGEGEHPSYLRGIGGEEAFGAGWAGAEYTPGTHLFADMPYYIPEDASNQKSQRLVGYRFYTPDSVHFRRSIHMRFGCKDHDISATTYWYSTKPVRPFFRLPKWEELLPGRELLRGAYDIAPPLSGEWWLIAPFDESALREALPIESRFDAAGEYQGRKWTRRAAFHGFIDFNHAFRPPVSNANVHTFSGVGIARCTLDAPADMRVRLRVSWDDHMVLRINGGAPIDLGDNYYFDTRTLNVPLRKGANVIILKNSNRAGGTDPKVDNGSNIGGWAFAFQATTPEGTVLLPAAR